MEFENSKRKRNDFDQSKVKPEPPPKSKMMLKGNNHQVIGVDTMNDGLYYSSD